MRIAIDGSVALRQQGGISEYTYRLLEALATLPTKQHEFYIITFGRDQRSLGHLPKMPANFHPIHVRLPQRLLDWTWRVFKMPKIEGWLPKIDLFFAPYFLVPAGNFSKLVVTIHDVIFLDHPEWFLPHDVVYYTSELKKTLARADQVIAISEATKTDLIRHQLFPAEKITVTPLAALYEEPRAEERIHVREKYALPDRYLLFISTLEPRKNIVRLLRAYQQLLRKRRDLPQLVLAGRRGWLGPELEELLAKEDLSKRAHLLGSFDRADRSALLAGAEALLFPSLAEGFGLPILEGMAAGVPVLTSNVSSMPEVAGDAALCINPLDEAALVRGLDQILFDGDLRQRLMKSGKRRARLFTWPETARQTLAVLEKAV